MPVLYEPNAPENSFVLTPDYDALIVEWANANPDHPDPCFTTDDCSLLTFHWPPDEPAPQPSRRAVRKARRRMGRNANGQFAKKE